MTTTSNLRELLKHDIASMKISACGNWIVFVTETGHELRFCAYGVVSVTVDEYWNATATKEGFHSYNITKG